jgi:hypothetical protein
MFNPSRDEARHFLFDVWRKHLAREPLTPLESMALDIVLLHPEYHDVLGNPEHYLERDYLPEFGETNPFLHLSLHLAIAEQLSIDQPAGIRAQFERLQMKLGGEHEALHALLECLAETIWQAQRQGTGFDGMVYLECLERR